MAKKHLLNIALLIFVIIIMLAFFEIGVRLFVPKNADFWEFKEDLPYLLKPNKIGKFVVEGEYVIKNSINSLGWHDKERKIEKSKTRIAVIGDSFVESLHVLPNETFTAHLDTQNPSIEVLNFGISGFSPREEFVLLKNHVLEYDPDVVILQLYLTNDVYGNNFELHRLVYGRSPAFDDDPDHMNSPYIVINEDESYEIVKGKTLLEQNDLLLHRGPFEKLKKGIRKHIRIYSYVEHKVGNIPALTKLLIKLGIISDIGPQNQDIPADYWVFSKDYDEHWENAFRNMLFVISLIDSTLEEENIEFIVTLMPSKEQVDDSHFEKIKETYPKMNTLEWDTSHPNNKVIAYCQKHNLNCIDLLPFVKKEANKNTPLYLEVDPHLNKQGHEALASIYKNTVIESPIQTSNTQFEDILADGLLDNPLI